MILGLVAAALLSVVPAAPPTTSSASDSDAVTELAQRYAPYVLVQQQPEPCGDGEPYDPSDVSAILDQPDVVLRSSSGDVLVTAPSDLDLAAAPPDSNIDLPGDAGNPGCDFERRFGRAASASPSTIYARVATDPERPDEFALQYWMYFVFNDWNNLHEGDWEMEQVVFHAPSPQAALQTEPVEMAVSQHDGNERRPWVDVPRLGDRPLVFAAVGSHAIYYSSQRWFGKSGATGFGCDDTRGPSDQLDSTIVVMPETVTPGDGFGWLTFPGRWGQRQASLNDSETGPPTTEQWIHPITWMETKGRDAAVTIPELGGVTGFFCTASTAGSRLLNDLLDRPVLIGTLLVGVVIALVFLFRRTRWSPVVLSPIMARRSVGQTIRSAWRLLLSRKGRYAPVALFVLAGGLLASLLQLVIVRISAAETFMDVVGRGSVLAALVVLLIGAAVTVPVAVVALGAAMVATNGLETDASGWSAFRKVWHSRVLGPLVVLTIAVVFGWVVLPLALFLIARWAVSPATGLREGSPLEESLATSRELTKGRRWRTLAIAALAITVQICAGLLVGTIVLLLTDSSFDFVNMIASAVSAIATPFVAVVIVMYHADLQVRQADLSGASSP